MRIIVILLAALMPVFSGKKAANTKIYLENGSGSKLIAFQETGELGKVTFRFLDAGSYRLVMSFPEQDGKWIKERPGQSTMTKAAWDPKSKTYYYQGVEGYFKIKIKGLRKAEFESFQPMFRQKMGEEDKQSILASFKAMKKNAHISLTIFAITAGSFKRSIEKINNDLSLYSIPGAGR